MAGKLDAALAWAARGFRVFPLVEGGKEPEHALGWTTAATTDRAAIRAWWTDPVTGVERSYNVGFLTSDHVVLDVDVKNGKPGLEAMFRHGVEFGQTFTVRTPTGGYHLYYQGVEPAAGCSPMCPGIDVKSTNGYVVAPGSEIAGEAYEVEFDVPVAPFPDHLRRLLRAPRANGNGNGNGRAAGAGVELDRPEAVEVAAHWLLHDAPVAVQGQNGDDTTYRVCCRVRDYGVSEAAALDLFLDEYNPRCEPPWSAAEARAKVENAYRYATGAAGAASAEAAFGDVVAVPPPAATGAARGPAPDPTGLCFGNMLDEEQIDPRAWIVTGFLMEGVLTLLNAPGGAGKSLMSLLLACHLAVGEDFWGYEMRRSGKSVVYNAEDDREEVSRRLNAICRVYGFDRDIVKQNVMIVGSDDLQLEVTKGSPPAAHEEHLARLAAWAGQDGVRLLCVDPLVEVHTGNENATVDMRYVMGLLRRVARTARVAVMAVHHTGKNDKGVAGDQNAGRGSSAVPAAARVVLTMSPASAADALEIGVPSADAPGYVRLDGAKASAQDARERTRTRWLSWRSVALLNGDHVGVLVRHDAAGAVAAESRRAADLLAARMRRDATATLPIEEAVTVLAEAADPMRPPEDRSVLRTRLGRLLASSVAVDGGRLALVTETQGSRKTTRVVLR